MPQNNSSPNLNGVNKILDNIDANMDDIYRQTYSAPQELPNTMDTIIGNLDKTLSKFNYLDNDTKRVGNVTRIYNRIEHKNSTANIGNGFFDMLENRSFMDNIMDVYSQNKTITTMDREYDLICKYMPKLKMALEYRKDNVLSADNFKKEFVNVVNETSGSDAEEQAIFSSNMDSLIKKYDFENLLDQMTWEAYIYGEIFLYKVPYKKAFEELLKRKGNSLYTNMESSILEGGVLQESFITEAGGDPRSFKEKFKVTLEQTNLGNDQSGLKIVLHKTGIYENIIEYHTKLIQNKSKISSMYGNSLYESFINESSEKTDEDKEYQKQSKAFKMTKTIDDDLSLDGLEANDGLVTNNKKEKRQEIKDIPGYVIRKLERKNVIPIYMEDICLGYYYLELSIDDDLNNENSLFSTTGFMRSTMQRPSHDNTSQDEMMKYISGKISEHIDANFINTNQDLRKEIYTILKYNDLVNITEQRADLNVSFFPADDVLHFALKKDPKTHRGISALYNSLIPAKLWIAITQSNAIGLLTRGQDKRIYYVKQTVETNVHKTLMNVINQLQRGNFGIRQLESINNILGIIGRFNEHVVPVGPSGDSPVNFEVMPGQDIKTNDEFLAGLEEQSIDPTGVPLELVNALKSLDYAIHYTMSNVKFLKLVYKDQTIVEDAASILITEIYNSEFNKNDELRVNLPAPTFLSMTNGSQLIENAKAYINAIVEVEMATEDDEVRAGVTRKLLRHFLPNHIDIESFDKIKEETKMEIAASKNANNDGEE